MKIMDDVLERCSLPAETGGALRLVLSGNSSLCVENHKGILELSGECVRLALSAGMLAVKGEGLALCGLDRNGLVVQGRILSLELE